MGTVTTVHDVFGEWRKQARMTERLRFETLVGVSAFVLLVSVNSGFKIDA